MTKNDLKLIGSFIDSKNIKEDLNYAHLLDDGIYATDTRKAIHYNIPMLNLNMFLHKKILAGYTNIMSKDDVATIDHEGTLRNLAGVKMNCNTLPDRDIKIAQIKNIFDNQFEYKMSLENIDDIHFELTQKECFIDDIHLNPLIQYSECKRYEVFFNKQKIENNITNTGMVKFKAIIMGREFKTQAQEQLLLDM